MKMDNSSSRSPEGSEDDTDSALHNGENNVVANSPKSENNNTNSSISLYPGDNCRVMFAEVDEFDGHLSKCKYCDNVFLYQYLNEHEERCSKIPSKMNNTGANSSPSSNSSADISKLSTNALPQKKGTVKNSKPKQISKISEFLISKKTPFTGSINCSQSRKESNLNSVQNSICFRKQSQSKRKLKGGGHSLKMGHWRGSSAPADSLPDLLSSRNNPNSSTSFGAGGISNFYKATVEQVHISHNPSSYTKPDVPYFGSTSSMLSAPETSAKTISFPKKVNVSSSVSSNSNYNSVPSSNTNYVNSAGQHKTGILSQIPVSTSDNPHAKNLAYNIKPLQSDKSAKSSYEEKGLKRKSSPELNDSDFSLSAPSSSSNYLHREQNISNNSKKNKVLGISSNLQLDDIDDDIQIITPKTSRDFHSNSNLLAKGYSSASGSSWSTASYRKPSVISESSSLSSVNSAKQTNSERDQNRLLGSQSSRQTAQEQSSTIHNPLSPEELQRMLDSVWSDLDEIASSNIASASGSTPETITIPPVSEFVDSSSSSVVSIYEVKIDANRLVTSKPPSPIVEEIPNPSDIPSLITIDSSPKDGELQLLKAKQEAENVKEDFKKLLEDELICNICTELLIKPINLGCSHTFCKFCISEWKEKKRQCPMCRAPIATETPCLFLDNFIGKAVEQLDPASVEKRLEIIKTREEQLKNKVCKPPVQLPQSSNLPQHHPRTLNIFRTYIPYQTYSNFVSRPSSITPQSLNILQPPSNLLQRPSNLPPQPLNLLQRISNMHPQHSNIVPQSSNILPQSSNVRLQSSNLLQRSLNILQQQSATITQLPSSIAQQSSTIAQQSSSNFGQLTSSTHHVPMNGYFY